MLYGHYVLEKDCAKYDLCGSVMYSREITVCVGQVSGLVKNFNTGIYTDTINVVNVKPCMMVLLMELYLFLAFSVTLTIYQGHSNVKHF